MKGISYLIKLQIDNVDFEGGVEDNQIEDCRKSLKDEILKALTTRLVKSVGDIKIVFNNNGFNIEIDNVDFVEIDDDKIEHYHESLKEHVKKALSRRYIYSVGNIKIIFNKK